MGWMSRGEREPEGVYRYPVGEVGLAVLVLDRKLVGDPIFNVLVDGDMDRQKKNKKKKTKNKGKIYGCCVLCHSFYAEEVWKFGQESGKFRLLMGKVDGLGI